MAKKVKKQVKSETRKTLKKKTVKALKSTSKVKNKVRKQSMGTPGSKRNKKHSPVSKAKTITNKRRSPKSSASKSKPNMSPTRRSSERIKDIKEAKIKATSASRINAVDLTGPSNEITMRLRRRVRSPYVKREDCYSYTELEISPSMSVEFVVPKKCRKLVKRKGSRKKISTRSSRSRMELSSRHDSEWEVEKICDSRFINGEEKFLVKWKGFSTKDNTWEPRRNLSNAHAAMQEFFKNHVYVVEEICDSRSVGNGALEYYVKWKGWPNSFNTWEPRSNLVKGASRELKKYEKRMAQV